MAPKKERQNPQRSSRRNSQLAVGAVGDSVARQQIVNSRAAIDSGSNFIPPTPQTPQPIVDTDRRHTEFLNEEKSRTTKEELDDIKHTHYKEKKKKEQNEMERSQNVVSKTIVLGI